VLERFNLAEPHIDRQTLAALRRHFSGPCTGPSRTAQGIADPVFEQVELRFAVQIRLRYYALIGQLHSPLFSISIKNMPEGKEISTETAQEVSKSQRRREALELKALARKLISMSPTKLDRIPLEQPIRAAVDEGRRIRSNVAAKRQLQYVAKLLRLADPAPLISAIAELDRDAQQLTARQHRAESWRDYLIDSGDPALSHLLQQRGDVDIQVIRQIVRSARAQAAGGKPPAAARSLFRLLRQMDEDTPLPQVPAD